MKLMRDSGWIGINGIAAAVLLAVLAGCGGGGSGDGRPADAGNYFQDAPAGVASLYKANCVNCHGSDLQGRVGANTNLQKVGSRMDASEIVNQIEQGKGVMPGFSDSLTEEEITALADWLAEKR